MSLGEWVAAVKGYMESQGIEEAPPPATSADLAALMEKLEAPTRSIR